MSIYVLDSNLEGVELRMLKEWFENGRSEALPEGVANYLAIMDQVHGFIQANHSKDWIVEFLRHKKLSKHQAASIYFDALEFFYINKDTKLEAWGNYYAEKLEKLYTAAIEMSETTKDLTAAKDILLAAMKARSEFRPVEHNLPAELFQRPIKLYTTDVRVIGLEKVSRRELAAHIDALDIQEEDKQRLRSESSIDPEQLILNNEVKHKG